MMARVRPAKVVLPHIPWGSLSSAVFFVVIILGVFTSFYTVSTEEVGVVTRFGRYIDTVEPGLRFKLPFFVDRVQKVPIQRQMKEEFGFRTEEAGQRTRYSTREYPEESLMVTGDLNAVDVEWSVQYRITSPQDYLFNVRDVDETLRNASESVMREVVGDRMVDEVLTVGRTDVEQTALTELQKLMDKYEMGMRIEQLVLQDVNPPEPVRASFNEVNQAQQEKERLINEARSDYNRVIPRARGEAEQGIQVAEGYALKRINEAQGDADNFEAIFAAYRLAPEITRQRLYLETLQEVLPTLGQKILVDDATQSLLPLMDVGAAAGRLPKTTRPQEAAQ